LLHLLQKFDLLLLYEENRGENERLFLVPSMLPVETKPTFDVDNGPQFFLVFCEQPIDGELSFDEASKGFLPEGLFSRLLKKAVNWWQHTGTGPVQEGMKPAFSRDWAQLSFGDHNFILELFDFEERQQMIRVQLLVENPELVVERITDMLEEIRSECMAQLEYFVAVHVPEAEDTLISLDRVRKTIGEGAMHLYIGKPGKGRKQQRLERAKFQLWCPPDVEDHYDIFISYRQTNESMNRAGDTVFARMLFDCLSKFVFGKEGRRLKVFLDTKRLLGGLSWKQGFIDGLKKTTVFMPIVSKAALEPMSIGAGFNSTMDGNDWCDNVLLEWKLGLEMLEMEDHPLKAIFPIMVGSEDPTAAHKMCDFFAEAKMVKLAAGVSKKTDAELLRVLTGANTTVGMGVAQTKERLLEQLGVKAWDPESTHGVGRATRSHWDIHAGCAKQVFQVLVKAIERESTGEAPAAKVPTRTKKGFRASAVSVSEAILGEGKLLKLSTGAFKRWQSRYFVVAGHNLKYASTQETVIASPKATVDLNALEGCVITRGTFLSLNFIDGMALELQAATMEEAEGWHELLAGFAPESGERKSSLIQSLEHYAPRKGTLVFGRKGSSEVVSLPSVDCGAPPMAPAPAAATAPAPAPAPASELSVLLTSLKLSDYHPALVAEGYDEVEDVHDMGMEELVEIGMLKGHAKRLLKHFGSGGN
jgi:hypothetical protein